MKKVLGLLLVLVFAASIAIADTVTLTSPEDLTPPTSQKLYWEITTISASAEVCMIRFAWLDAGDNRIPLGGSREGWKVFACRNHYTDGNPAENNLDCLDVADPYPCCTGLRAGTCDDLVLANNADCVAKGDPYECCTAAAVGICTCFDDTFKKSVTNWSGIVGVGLRGLLFDQWKKVYLTGANDGSF